MIPTNQECNYCQNQTSHGGTCYNDRKFHSIPCLQYKQDPRGTIKFTESHLTIEIGHPIPTLNQWSDDFSLGGKDTPIKFTKITPIEWHTNRTIAIKCKTSFYHFDNTVYDDQNEKKLGLVIPIRKG